MQYGHFDGAAREYVITKPNTPAPWANYLGSPEYGAIVTNNAGGYSFVKSGAAGRVLRYRFNEQDKPGRYIYLRDDNDGDFWSASWQPVGKPMDVYKSECRHGTGYTRLTAEYKGIKSVVDYYVPHEESHEIWHVQVTNISDEARKISAFGYAEFTNEPHYEQDQVNLQYTQFITKTEYENNFIRQIINENFQAFYKYAPKTRYFGLAGADVTSYCGDREKFLADYSGYGNPQGVVNGRFNNDLNYNGNSCGALHTAFELNAGETKTFTFILGEKQDAEFKKIQARYANQSTPENEINALKTYWHGKFTNLVVKTPDERFNHMINTWNAYNCFITFYWSRAASLAYCGQRNGYGYRDTVQDIQGIIHLDPKEAREKLIFMISAQVHHGAGLPLVRYTHTPGKEDTPDQASYRESTGHPSYRADDMMWVFPTVWKYIAETGDMAFLDEVVPYADKGEDTVYNHLRKAIEFTENHLGIHGLPAGLHADWNDCLRMGAQGISVFVALQFYYSLEILARFARKRGESPAEYEEKKTKYGKIIEEKCWDNDRFVRGITDKDVIIGAAKDPEANMWLNPQSWAVISGYVDEARGKLILDTVHSRLNTPYGVRIMDPSYVKHAFDGALALLFNPSTKENGGIFLHTQGWIILAEALLGRGNRAYEYYLESCPAAQNEIAEIRKIEPYVYSQFTESIDSPNEGRSHVHWLTGTASTVMVGCVEGILGLRPDPDGLRLAPAIPGEWKEFTMTKIFRDKVLEITVKNPGGKEGGTPKVTLNGEALNDNYLPAANLKDKNSVEVIL
ncbi:MAG: N,N'-diacetylchitobiose phosphorylase [Defluviitaleaceae bacterium]|nr:N,N'-diacetylchitobiose phosphorylase [Defluviitaleaceae bacterium]MCL2273966.1 N,N'-diacetylchitobiose phosphorylase [Defluviitaleaceae bacterium]